MSKQETTLEKAAEVYASKKGDIPTTKLEDAIFKQGFIDGAKWQQEQQDNIEKLAKDYEDSVVYADKGVVYHAFIEGYNKAKNYIDKPELNDLNK